MMNGQRLNLLLTYMGALTKLRHDGDYVCFKEISECIKWIREEFEEGSVGNSAPDPKELAKYIAREIEASDDITPREALDLLALVTDAPTEADAK